MNDKHDCGKDRRYNVSAFLCDIVMMQEDKNKKRAYSFAML